MMGMTDEKEYLSREKLKELTKELEELSTVKRREVAEALEQAKSAHCILKQCYQEGGCG